MTPVPAKSAQVVPGILASAATGITPFIERMGGDVDRVFGNARISPSMAGSPTLKLKLTTFCGLFEEASRQTKNGNFGLWFGNQFQPRDLGMWGYAAVSSPTLGDALKNLVTLFRYHQGSSLMRLARGRDGLQQLEYRIVAPDIIERRQDAELSLGMFLNVIREARGPRWAPEEIHFEHPRPCDAHEHEKAFDAPVYFSQPANMLLFRPEILSNPMPARDPRLLAMMRTCLERLGNQEIAEQPLMDSIKAAVRSRLPQGYPTLQHVSEDMRMPLGAIHRELSDAHLGYKDLVEAVRRDLAVSYVKQKLPFSDVALLLGYSELSAFSRAFRRWTGLSPRAYRAIK